MALLRRTPATPPPPPPNPHLDPVPPADTPVQHYACSLCSGAWTDDHASVCRARVYTEASLASALTERMEGPLADAYAQGAQDALHRLRSSLPPEHQEVLDALLDDYRTGG